MIRRSIAVLVGVLTFVGVPTAASAEECATELPGLGVKLLEAPRELADLPRAQVAIFDELNPGAEIERRIRFSNGDAERDLSIAVYATSAEVAEGQFRIAEGRNDNELTGWIDVSSGQLVIPACGHVEVTASIAVPVDATGGERYALIAAEHQPEGAVGAVTVGSRIGVRVYLQVAGPEPARTELEIETLTPGRDAAGDPTLTVDLLNPGDRAIDVTTAIELTEGPGGSRVGPFTAEEHPTLAPGERRQVVVSLDADLPNGPWRAVVTARTGEIERRAEAVITFPEAGLGEAVPLHPLQDRSVLLPIAGALLVLALLLLLLAWRRRRRDDEAEGGAADPPHTPDQTRALVGSS